MLWLTIENIYDKKYNILEEDEDYCIMTKHIVAIKGDGIQCDDIDECLTGNICSPYATCTNTIGNYTCTCNNGFWGNGTHCEDIDECETNNTCSPNATCTNTIGNYTCACNDGFSGNGSYCADIDECGRDRNCSADATCNNTVGSYICTCNAGYTGDGIQCDDIDECLTGNICSPDATCTNTIGNYTCTCNNGFWGNGTHCEDIDECETNNICSLDATCTNTIGNYTCACNDGFSGNGTHCEDVNECETGDVCSPYATCTNTEGSYICICNDRFTGNGVDCSCIAQCDKNYCSNGGTCTRDGVDCSPQCTCLPAFTGGRCTEAAESYNAELRPDTKKRSLNVTLTSKRNFTYDEGYELIKDKLQDAPYDVADLFDHAASGLTDKVWSSITDNMTAIFMARFSYKANITIFLFLNNNLLEHLKNHSTRSKLSIDDIVIDGVTEDFTLDLIQLAEFAFCANSKYKVDLSDLQCTHCEKYKYCKNDANCVIVNNNVSCICKPFSIYTTSGPQCEHFYMNLGAFFGILFGALSFLLLLLLGIWFAVRWYRKRKQNEEYADETYESRFSWKTSLFSSFERLGELDIPTSDEENKPPHLVDWKPQLEKVNSSTEVKIKRPEIKSDSFKKE
ncbi:uncharacterized protein LOC143803979 [Ranitomeya variabilis]|uniref:uncharacterized protein LOC143803979 n=1 Tax=Ranitomeya variabilis TaxID=490064 RepID=UPI004057801A